MATYIVLEPQDTMGISDKAVFIRDGFTIGAFILPAIWLLFSRLWLEAALSLLTIAVLGVIAGLLNAADIATYLALAVSLFIGAEFTNWRIKRLVRKGYKEKTVIEARNQAEAEIRYYYAFADDIAPVSGSNVYVSTAQSTLITPPILSHTHSRQIGLVGHRGDS